MPEAQAIQAEVMEGIREWDTPRGFHVLELHYRADPAKRAPGWAEKTRKALAYTRAKWDREFEIDWLAGLGECYFGADLLKRHYWPRSGGAFNRGALSWRKKDIAFRPSKAGNLYIWRYPARLTRGELDIKHYHRYVVAGDVAEGLEKGDYSAAYVLDRLNFEVVAAYHGHPTVEAFAAVLDLLGRWYAEPEIDERAALLGVEANNHGLTVLNELSSHLNYPNLYRQEKFDKVGEVVSTKLGWTTSTKTKPIAVDGLAKVLREKELVIHDRLLIQECLTFIQKDGKLGAAGVAHDDRVMAAAILIQMHKFAPPVREYEPPVTGWRANQADQADGWVGI